MSELLDAIKDLVLSNDVQISDHGYDELSSDHISAREAVAGIGGSMVVREYLEYGKGPVFSYFSVTRMASRSTLSGVSRAARIARRSW